MAINFPASPSVNDTFTVGSITYQCVQTNPIKWIGLGVTPADRLVEGSNSLEINASNNLVWTGGSTSLNNTSINDQLSIGSGSSANSEYGLIAYANSNSLSNRSAVYARNIGGGRNFTGDNSAGATTFEVYSSGTIVSTQSSSSEITSYNTINSGSGNNRILIRTQANQGGDPYIKFDAGGSNMIVGTQYNGTTNNKLVLGEGEDPSDVDGLHISGNGNGTFTASLSTGNEVYVNGTDATTQRYLNFVRPTSGEYRATLRRDAWYLGETVQNIGDVTPTGANITLKMNGDATFAGNCLFGTTSNGTTVKGIVARSTGEFLCSRTNGPALLVNRLGNDGSLVDFRGQNSSEGSISVSGGTISYNGAHLSRWSQLPGNAERIEILRGSVLSNVDEMCEWGDEDNEQLNRMKVSDVEGDRNVAGVFQDWDDDEETYINDFYCAMTGDFVIRIAQGTTVARGDLLMSAGDGTAKPQDDDIVRSKTVAKVTSTTVSATYADGSYCVPCVLMAC